MTRCVMWIYRYLRTVSVVEATDQQAAHYHSDTASVPQRSMLRLLTPKGELKVRKKETLVRLIRLGEYPGYQKSSI